MNTIYENRIVFKGEIEILLINALELYNLGTYVEHKVIETGYEDLNIKVETNKGVLLVKFFAQVGPYSKNDADAVEYIQKIAAAMQEGICMPKLIKNLKDSYLSTVVIEGKEYKFCIQEFVQSIKNAELSLADIVSLAQSMAKLHNSTYCPAEYYDEWSVINFKKEYLKRKKNLEIPDKKLVRKVFAEYKEKALIDLPHSFVHADLIKSNIIKSKDNIIYIIDFSVAFFGPRILDIAVLASNVTFFPDNIAKSTKYLNIFLNEYQKTHSLTPSELTTLPLLIKVCFAMYILNSSKEIANKNQFNDEDYYWREIGRNGLKLDHYEKVFSN